MWDFILLLGLWNIGDMWIWCHLGSYTDGKSLLIHWRRILGGSSCINHYRRTADSYLQHRYQIVAYTCQHISHKSPHLSMSSCYYFYSPHQYSSPIWNCYSSTIYRTAHFNCYLLPAHTPNCKSSIGCEQNRNPISHRLYNWGISSIRILRLCCCLLKL